MGYLVAVAVAEVEVTLVQPEVGLWLHAVLLAALLLSAAQAWGRPHYHLLAALAFAPLIRIMSLALPMDAIPQLYWYVLTGVPLFIAVAIAVPALGFSWAEIGINPRWLPLQLPVALTGVAFGYVEFQILKPAPLVQSLTWEQMWLPSLILLFCTGLVEELIFRGLLQRAAVELLGRWGVLYVAVLFAVLHLGYKSAPDMLLVFSAGLFFGFVVDRTGSLLGVALAHGATNIMLMLVIPLLPSLQSLPALR